MLAIQNTTLNGRRRISLLTFQAHSGLALLLATIGLYGVLSYLVTRRQAEFGIRMALGAQPNSVLGLVMVDVVEILIAGLAVGICISLACTRLLQKMLFGLSPHDASTMVLAVCVLFVTAILAGGIPAWRASRVDPMVALRYEYASPKLLLRNGGNSSCSAFRRNLLPSSSVYLSERDMRRAG